MWYQCLPISGNDILARSVLARACPQERNRMPVASTLFVVVSTDFTNAGLDESDWKASFTFPFVARDLFLTSASEK
jgi:hypothetical protein